MAEYIEREKVLEEINDIITDYIKDNSIQCSIAAGTALSIRDDVIIKQSAVDVVSVVRCRDCKWYKLPQLACALPNRTRWTAPNDYCSYGERRCSR